MSSTKRQFKIIKGEPLYTCISQVSLGIQLYESLKYNYSSEIPALFNIKTEESMSFKELFISTCKLGQWMRDRKLEQNDVVLICCENIKEYFIPVTAAFYSCIVVANASPSNTENELTHAITLIKPKMIFCTASTKTNFTKLANKIQMPTIIQIEYLNEIISNTNIDPMQFQPKNCNVYEQTAVIMFSSGTTGLFKAVMLTHRNYNARINQTQDPRIAITEGESIILFLPFYHAYGFVLILLHLIKGKRINFMSKFDLTILLQAIEKYKISMLPLVPPVMVLFAKSPEMSKYDTSSVEQILCGAAPLSPEIEAANRKVFPNAKIRQGYGLTEVTFAATLFYNKDIDRKAASCGTVIPGNQIIVRDPETGDTLGPHEIGEFCTKSETVMKGYFGNPEATRATFTEDEWLRTGDMCYYDEDNYFYIVDRLKELIKYKALQIAPAELEALLLTHPKILDAAVVGKPDDEAGEVPLAFVVKRSEISEREIQEFVKRNAAAYKALRGGVRFIKAIPKSASGKILRRELRELINNKSHL